MDFDPNIILLDVNLPDINGFELCKYINKELSIPIILITARNDVVDKVLGLELGAHDYITKPFHIKEVLARIRAALRSRAIYSSTLTNDLSIQPIAISPVLKVDFDSRLILKNNEEIKLNPKEFEILSLLSKNKNKIFTRDALLNTIWGYEYFGEDRTVDVHIRRLRAKIDTPDFSHIETVFGVGYVMR
ncbi:Transcriptional regulatory protein WalR [compost metagenome]